MRRPSVRLISLYLNKKSKAIKLRKKGQSYKEVADTLRISKSTAYFWTKKIKLSISAQKRIKRKIKEALGKGLIAYNKVYSKIRSREAAKIREGFKEKASKEIKKISKKDIKLIGTALYWAEGNTKNRNRLQFSNSNPLMIKVAMRFFREICNIPDKRIKVRAHIYPGINYRNALNFWSRITKLPKNNFYYPQTQISKSSKGKRLKNTLPYGTIHLTVTNTEITCRVKGWIRGIAEKF